MMDLDEIKKNRELINSIDWDMTPEQAVRLYLEWGNNWTSGYHMVRSKDDVAYYFVLNTWEADPVVYLVKRNSEESVDVAKIELPEGLRKVFPEEGGISKGVYSLDGEIQAWLKKELDA